MAVNEKGKSRIRICEISPGVVDTEVRIKQPDHKRQQE